MYNVYRTCAIGQLRAMVQAPVSGNEAHVAGWGEAGRPGGQCRSDMTARLSALVGWHCGAARPPSACAGVDRRVLVLCEHIFHRHYVRPCLLRTRDGLAGWGRRRTYRPVSRTAVNDAHPWKLYTPAGMCAVGDVMYVCHSIRRTDRNRDNGTAVDIKAHTPLIPFVVDLLVCCT